MNSPWTDGPKELIQHAIDHLSLGSDFDKRIAMISIDNSVELILKPIIAVKENKTCLKDKMPDEFILVENYLEAVGIIQAMKIGISPKSIRRPLTHTPIYETLKCNEVSYDTEKES